MMLDFGLAWMLGALEVKEKTQNFMATVLLYSAPFDSLRVF
jgi:hypothetical protein